MTEKEQYIALVDNDQQAPADAIILLQGDGFARLRHAVEIYLNGLAPKVVFSGGVENPDCGSYPYQVVLPELLKLGMNEEDLLWENKSQNTRQQALEVMTMCREKGWESVILVASHFHQYRAFLTFLKTMEDTGIKLLIHNSPARDMPWFQPTFGTCRFELLEREFEKITRYGENGHVATFEQGISYLRWKELRLNRPG